MGYFFLIAHLLCLSPVPYAKVSLAGRTNVRLVEENSWTFVLKRRPLLGHTQNCGF